MARRENIIDLPDAPVSPSLPRPKSTQPAQNSGGSSQSGTDRIFQSSERGKPLPLAYGTVRVGPNIIERYDSLLVVNTAPYWTPDTDYLVLGNVVRSQGNTYALITAGHSSATGTLGNGPGGTGTDIVDGTAHWKYIPPGVYTAMVLGYCEGQAYGTGKVWQDSRAFSDISQLVVVSANYQVFLGTPTGVTRPAWFPIGSDPLPDYYSNTVVLFINGTSGADATVPNVSLEVKGIFADATHVDASPADIALDMLTHPRRGILWPSARVDAISTGSANASSWRNYCTAYGLNLSWVIDTQTDVLSLLGLLLDATNSDAIQTNRPDGLGFMLKFVPRGDQALTANGVTFTPNTTATAIGPDDLLEPITSQRSPPIDRFNSCPIEYVNRAGDYVRDAVDDPDMADVELRGLRRATTFPLPQVIAPESAIMLSRIRAQRSLNVVRTFTLKLPDRFLLLEPTDLLTVSDPVMGLVNVPMRVTAVAEDQASDGRITITAEDWPGLVHAAAAYTPQAGDGYKPNQGTPIARSPVVPSQVSLGTLTDASTTRGPAVHNIWPNASSEASPPDGAVLTSPEWAARVNVGTSAAFAGSWVRELISTHGVAGARLGDQMAGTDPADSTFSILSLKVPCSPGDQFAFSARMRFSVAPTTGTSSAVLLIYFLDSTENQIGSGISTASSTGAYPTAYVQMSGATVAPAATCFALFRLASDPTIATGSVVAQFDGISVIRSNETSSDAAQSGTALTVAAGGNVWTDIPGTSQSFTPNTASRKIKVTLAFSAFGTVGSGGATPQVRIVFGGTPTQAGIAYKFIFMTLSQYQSWTFMWSLPAGTLGPVGTAVTVKAQMISPTTSGQTLNMDANTYATMIIEEIG